MLTALTSVAEAGTPVILTKLWVKTAPAYAKLASRKNRLRNHAPATAPGSAQNPKFLPIRARLKKMPPPPVFSSERGVAVLMPNISFMSDQMNGLLAWVEDNDASAE